MPNICVTEIVGSSTVVTVKYSVGGKTGSAKAFKNEYQKETPAFEVGKSYDVEFEKKTNRDGEEETWLKKSKPASRGGGRAPDPERAKIDREKLDLDKNKQSLIMAQFVLGQAVQLATTMATAWGAELSTLLVQQVAIDLVGALEETHGEITKRFTIA